MTTTIDKWFGQSDFTRTLDKSCRLVLNLGGKWIHVSPLGVDVAETYQVKGIEFQKQNWMLLSCTSFLDLNKLLHMTHLT